MTEICPRCPHPDHEFSTCLEYPECQCYDRPGIPGGVCDNTLAKVLDAKERKEKQVRVPNRAMRRRQQRRSK